MAALLRSALLALLLLALPSTGSADGQRLHVPAGAVPETVFDWSEQACETWDVPDAPARAWVGADGRVRLLAGHHRARLLSGPSLDALEHDCRVVFESGRRDDPSRYDDFGWLRAPYTTDGRTVHALVHNEFHGHRRPSLCPAGGYMECWWNAVVATVSHDGGASFAAPGRFAAGLPYRYRGDLGRRAGLFGPSNIVMHDGWYYTALFAERLGAQRRGVCLMRTRDLSDPASWRAWDGRDFTVRFADPYRGPADPARHVCTPLARSGLPFMVSSLVRDRRSGTWFALMAGRRAPARGAEPVTGIWASASTDLIHWSPPHPVWAAPLLTHRDCGREHAFYYPAVLDPDSPSRNFEDTDGDAWLYLTRLRLDDDCRAGPERDLVRLPLRVEPRPTPSSPRNSGDSLD